MATIVVAQSGGDYSTLANALSNASNDDDISIEGTWSVDDTSAATVSDTGLTITADSDSKHPGYVVASSPTHYRLRVSGSHCITVNSTGCTIDGLVINQNGTGTSDEAIRMAASGGTLTVNNSILYATNNSSQQDGIYKALISATINVENTYIYGFSRCGIHNQDYNEGSTTATWNIDSCVFFGNGTENDGGSSFPGNITIFVLTNRIANINCFNTISVAHGGGNNSEDYRENVSGGTTTWNIDNCIDSDGSITSRDSGAVSPLENRTATDNTSPGTGDWVIFEDITTAPYDFRLVDNAENDAQDAHTAATGAGLSMPSTDNVGTSRPQNTNYDIGAFEIPAAADEETVVIGDGTLSITGYAPDLVVTHDFTSTDLTITGYAPTVAEPIQFTEQDLSITGYAPDLVVTHDFTSSDLTIIGYAPVIASPAIVLTQDLTITGYAPDLVVTKVVISSDLSIDGYAPTVAVPVRFTEQDLSIDGETVDLTLYIPFDTQDLTITGYQFIASAAGTIIVAESGGDYDNLAAAIAAASNGSTISIQGTWSSDDTSSGMTISLTDLTIETDADSKHPGKYDTSQNHYRLHPTGAYDQIFDITGGNVTIDGLAIYFDSTTTSAEAIRFFGPGSGAQIIRNTILMSDAGVDNQEGVRLTSNVGDVTLENTQIIGIHRNGILVDRNNYAGDGTLNIDSCTIYGCNGQSSDLGGGVVIDDQNTGQTFSINIFNSIIAGNSTTDLQSDDGLTGLSWDIHNSIDSDGTISTQDSGAANCLESRTVTDSSSPGAGDWVIFNNITTFPYDVRLMLNPENDAYNAHTDASGAGLSMPATDIAGTSRPQLTNYDIGSFEIPAESTAEPSTQDLTITGYSPVVAEPVRITEQTLTITGYAPSVGDVAQPQTVELTITGYAPSLFLEKNVQFTEQDLSITGYQVEASTEEGTYISISEGTLTIEGYAPFAGYVQGETGSITITEYAPTLGVQVTPISGVIRIRGQTLFSLPTTKFAELLGSPLGLTFTQFSIRVSDSINECQRTWRRLPDTYLLEQLVSSTRFVEGSVDLTGYAPSLSRSFIVADAPEVGTLAITGYAPTVGLGAQVVVSPLSGSISIEGYIPVLEYTVPVGTTLSYDPTDGRIEADITFADAYTSYAETEILDGGAGSPNVLYISATGDVVTNDGTTANSINLNWSAGDNIKVIIVYGSGVYELSILVNDTTYYSKSVDFDGSYGGAGTLTVNSPAGITINDVGVA